jgi:predicted dinucleotide-binding enzyme
MKKVGILGSGAVAKVLASGFLKYGYDVMVGSRDTSKLSEWKQKNEKGKTGTFKDTAEFGDIIVLAVKGAGALDTVSIAGIKNLNGKTIIDATNPIDDKRPPDNGVLHFFTSLEESLMERLQKAAPDANFVKSFNIVGNAFMVDPDFNGVKPTMFICGNNENAKNEVKTILEQFGHEVEDMGKAEAARAIEPLCILWCIPGFISNSWMHAFKLLKK